MGFCLYNNAAAAAQWALGEKRLSRMAVVDFDVHHGNGTQEIFWRRNDLLYISTHQHPLYPGTGMFGEQGDGPGLGLTVNFPIPPARGNAFYTQLFDQLLLPVLEQYRPEAILASAGYDAHRDDPLAQMELDEKGFAQLAARLNQAARRLCGGRILYLLEGGYNLRALSASVLATVQATLDGASPASMGSDSRFAGYRSEAVAALKEHWES